jgi:uncharacterized protein YutE (UPF0331/DUF86 family)
VTLWLLLELLGKKCVIDRRLTEELKKMSHFRNVVIHEYQRVDINIVKSVILSGLSDLILFGDRIEECVSSLAS